MKYDKLGTSKSFMVYLHCRYLKLIFVIAQPDMAIQTKKPAYVFPGLLQ